MAIQKKIVAAGKQGININVPSSGGRKKVLMVAGITVLLLLILSLYLFLGRQPVAGQAIFTGQTNLYKAGYSGDIANLKSDANGAIVFPIEANLGNKNSTAYTIEVKYNPAKLSVLSVVLDSKWEGWKVTSSDDTTGVAKIEYATIDYTKAITGNKVLGTINFKLKVGQTLSQDDIKNDAIKFNSISVLDLDSPNGQSNIVNMIQPSGEIAVPCVPGSGPNNCNTKVECLSKGGVWDPNVTEGGTSKQGGTCWASCDSVSVNHIKSIVPYYAGVCVANCMKNGVLDLTSGTSGCAGNSLYCAGNGAYQVMGVGCQNLNSCPAGTSETVVGNYICSSVVPGCGNGVVDQGEVCDAANKDNTGCTGNCKYVKIGYTIGNCAVGSKGCEVLKWSAAEVFAIKALALAKGSCYPGEMNKNVDPAEIKLYCDNNGVAITALENGKLTSPKKVQLVVELSKALKEYLVEVS